MASKTGKDDSFESLYGRLEEAVSKLEKGGLTLEESLGLYEEGVELAKRCQEMLQQAELRITRLQESFTNGAGLLREEAGAYEAEPVLEDAAEEMPLE